MTFGTSCAPYLSNKVVKSLATGNKMFYPLAAAISNEDIYVEDIFFGGQDLTNVRRSRDQLIKLISTANLQLRK